MIFCKAPVPGQVKTRLAKSIGDEAACQVHQQLTHRTLQELTRQPLTDIQLWCAPSIEHRFFQQCRQRYGVELREQGEGDLGVRMARAFAAALSTASCAVIVGTDCPLLDQAYVDQAFAALAQGEDTVIGPAEDGGYVLLGLRQPQPAIFEAIDWGTARVMQQTLQRLTGTAHCLPSLWDVDQLEDLRRLCDVTPDAGLDADFSAWLAQLNLSQE